MQESDYTIIQINGNSWRIENGGVRFFLLTGTERALLVDSGMTVHCAKEIAEGLTGLPVSLFNTHADPDHIGSNGEFDRFYMHPAEESNYRSRGGTGDIQPVREGDVIDLGGRKLAVIGLPGHTPGSIALLDIDARVLISGDPIQQGTVFMFGPQRNMAEYIGSLERLEQHRDKFDWLWPSHGVFPVGRDTLDLVRRCAGKIVRGEADGRLLDFHGRQIVKYDFGAVAFLCDRPQPEGKGSIMFNDAMELIRVRHSVRQYLDKPIPADVRGALDGFTAELNLKSGLNMQVIYDEPECFSSRLAKYGRFENCANYIALVGRKAADLNERCGYYGELLVLKAQELGLNTCWVALTRGKSRAKVGKGETEAIVISLGYGKTGGASRKTKSPGEVSNVTESSPEWFKRGVEAALLAPTAVNQQKFYFALEGGKVRAKAGTFGTNLKLDLGIVKCHFELGAGKENFSWAE